MTVGFLFNSFVQQIIVPYLLDPRLCCVTTSVTRIVPSAARRLSPRECWGMRRAEGWTVLMGWGLLFRAFNIMMRRATPGHCCPLDLDPTDHGGTALGPAVRGQAWQRLQFAAKLPRWAQPRSASPQVTHRWVSVHFMYISSCNTPALRSM